MPPTGNRITFGNELNNALQPNGNGKIDCNPAGYATASPADDTPCEYITYKLTANDSGAACSAATCTLRRANTANSADVGDAVARFVDGSGGLSFTYLESDGTALDAGDTESQITAVSVELKIRVPGDPPRTQTLATKVDLRNR